MRFCLEEAAAWKAEKEHTFQQINQSGLPLVLFGKASVIDGAFLNRITVPVSVICDNDPTKQGTRMWGLDVISPSRLSALYSAYNVLILVPFEHEIVPQLEKLPVPPTRIFRLDLYFEEADPAGFFGEAQSALEKIYCGLADQKSKDTYEAVIHYRLNRDPRILEQISLPRGEQYFPADLGGRPMLSADEVFADVGAFTGDTVEKFCSAVRGQYRAIYAFEPECANYQRLLRRVQAFPNVFCRQVAASDSKGEIRFMNDDSGSKADLSGDETIQADTLDHLLLGTPVTYLKMDVEGMEYAALQGAKNLIRTARPKLAICTYHLNADMLRIPQLIWEMDPNYHLFFRHYTNALVETVCYAV